jgi:FtsP/CotA-like multicopper oxidase with cupredoxin domain
VPLVAQLPNSTAIYHEWPPTKLRKKLPRYLTAAVIANNGNRDEDTAGTKATNKDVATTFMGPPIHVQARDILSVTMRNSLQSTGLSLHWHGFEMEGAIAYDGVVGVTQCPVPSGSDFVYEFAVNETPGTYWYHTHSGHLGVHAYNAIKGPLIVHPAGHDRTELIDALNDLGSGDARIQQEDSATNDASTGNGNATLPSLEILSQLSYANERIFMFSDGFLKPGAIHYEHQLGNLNAPISKNDDSDFTATSAKCVTGPTSRRC